MRPWTPISRFGKGRTHTQRNEPFDAWSTAAPRELPAHTVPLAHGCPAPAPWGALTGGKGVLDVSNPTARWCRTGPGPGSCLQLPTLGHSLCQAVGLPWRQVWAHGTAHGSTLRAAWRWLLPPSQPRARGADLPAPLLIPPELPGLTSPSPAAQEGILLSADSCDLP